MTMYLVRSLIGVGRFEEATTITEREFRDESGRLMRLLKIAAAKGDDLTTKTLLDKYEPMATKKQVLMEMIALAGQRERANELAAEIDSTPFGYLTLIRAIHTCLCGAPFDLEATPNFAKRIEDADLPWPPLSPMDWPLKD